MLFFGFFIFIFFGFYYFFFNKMSEEMKNNISNFEKNEQKEEDEININFKSDILNNSNSEKENKKEENKNELDENENKEEGYENNIIKNEGSNNENINSDLEEKNIVQTEEQIKESNILPENSNIKENKINLTEELLDDDEPQIEHLVINEQEQISMNKEKILIPKVNPNPIPSPYRGPATIVCALERHAINGGASMALGSDLLMPDSGSSAESVGSHDKLSVNIGQSVLALIDHSAVGACFRGLSVYGQFHNYLLIKQIMTEAEIAPPRSNTLIRMNLQQGR